MSYYRGEITRRHPVAYGIDLTPTSYTQDLMLDIRGKNQIGEFVVEDPVGTGTTRKVYNAVRLEPVQDESLEDKSVRMHESAMKVGHDKAHMYTNGMRDQLLYKFSNGTGSGYRI